MSLRERLREETRSLHEQVETIVDISRRLASRRTYRDYLGRLYGLVLPIEHLLNQPELQWPGLVQFKRATLIAADLLDLGFLPADLETLLVMSLPAVESPASALGVRYVIEGSALGGRMIFRQNSTQLKLTAEQGGRYLAGTDDILANWRQLVAVLDTIPADGRIAELALQGATMTFELFGAWFK